MRRTTEMIVILLAAAAASAEVPTYSVEVIATYTDTTSVRNVSPAGHVVGYRIPLDSGLILPFVATLEDGLQFLPLPVGYTTGVAFDANSAGVIVGTVAQNGFPFDGGRPAIWTPDANGNYTCTIPQQFTQLPSPLGMLTINGGMIVGINDDNTMVGWSRYQGFQGGPTTLFSPTDPPVNLRELGFEATVNDLSESNLIVGDNLRMDLNTMAITNLGFPTPPNDSFTFAIGYSVNDSGQVVAAARRATSTADRWLTYVYTDLEGWQPHNPAVLPSPFVGFYDNNNLGDVSANGGVRFGPEDALFGSFEVLLDPAFSNWDVGLGFINDDRRVYTLALDTSTATSAIVVLVPSTIPCQADLNGDGLLDFFDVSDFLADFQNNEPSTDLNNDGLFDFFDVTAYLNLFSAGCP